MTAEIILATLSLVVAEVRAGCDEHTGTLAISMLGVDAEVSGDGFRLRRMTERGPAPKVVEPLPAHGDDRFIMGRTESGDPYRLTLGKRWRLSRGGVETDLDLPSAVGRLGPARLLGFGKRHVWFAAAELLIRIELETARVNAATVGRGKFPPVGLSVADDALIAVGVELLRCSTPGRCVRLGKLPGPIKATTSGPGGRLYALAGSSPGLYRAPENSPLRASMVMPGKVLALCDMGEGEAWAVLRRGSAIRVVAAATASPAVRPFAPAEILSRALLEGPEPDAKAVGVVLGIARRDGWPELEALAFHAMRDPRAEVREAAAATMASVRTTRGLAALWLLGHDGDANVRVNALRGGIARCRVDSTLECSHLLGGFLDDVEPTVAWTARDLMLEYNPTLALRNAPAPYKLDAIASLVSRMERDGEANAHHALKVLAADRDPEIRAAAAMALAGMGH